MTASKNLIATSVALLAAHPGPTQVQWTLAALDREIGFTAEALKLELARTNTPWTAIKVEKGVGAILLTIRTRADIPKGSENDYAEKLTLELCRTKPLQAVITRLPIGIVIAIDTPSRSRVVTTDIDNRVCTKKLPGSVAPTYVTAGSVSASAHGEPIARRSPPAEEFPSEARLISAGKGKPEEITSCAAFEQKLGVLQPNAKAVFSFQPPQAPEKSEFETTAAFEERVRAYARGAAEKAALVYNVIALDKDRMSYDAETETMRISYGPFDFGSGSIGLDRWLISEDSYIGSNAFGVTRRVEVERYAILKGKLRAPEKVYPVALELKMPASEAKAFKDDRQGRIHVLSRLLKMETGNISRGTPTIDRPTDYFFNEKIAVLDPLCVRMTSGKRLVPGWAPAL